MVWLSGHHPIFHFAFFLQKRTEREALHAHAMRYHDGGSTGKRSKQWDAQKDECKGTSTRGRKNT